MTSIARLRNSFNTRANLVINKRHSTSGKKLTAYELRKYEDCLHKNKIKNRINSSNKLFETKTTSINAKASVYDNLSYVKVFP